MNVKMNKNSSRNTSGIMWIVAVASMVLAAAALPASADDGGAPPNAEQSGINTACEDLNALYLVDEVSNPLAVVQVDGASGFVTSSSSGVVYIFFHNSNGQAIEVAQGPSGVTPAWAATGTICVAQEDGLGLGSPFVTDPEIGASWTYQDGF